MSGNHGRPSESHTAPAPACDTELEQRVRTFLAGLTLPGMRGVSVRIDGGVAHLGGTVGSFHEKQLATHCCQRVAGVIRVVNNVHVADVLGKETTGRRVQRPR